MGAVVNLVVRFSDLDAQGHVNYAVYLTYLEEALNALWAIVAGRVCRQLNASDLGYVSARAEIDYARPTSLGCNLEISVAVKNVGTKSFTTTYRIIERDSQEVIATAQTIQVVTLKGPTSGAMPSDIHSALSAFLDPAQEVDDGGALCL